MVFGLSKTRQQYPSLMQPAHTSMHHESIRQTSSFHFVRVPCRRRLSCHCRATRRACKRAPGCVSSCIVPIKEALRRRRQRYACVAAAVWAEHQSPQCHLRLPPAAAGRAALGRQERKTTSRAKTGETARRWRSCLLSAVWRTLRRSR